MGILNYTFDWSVLYREPYGAMMLSGISLTLRLSILSWMIALALGILIGICRVQSIKWLRFAGAAYVQIIRNVPLLVHVFLWYYAAPLILPKSAQKWLYDTVTNYAFWAGVVALGSYTASRVAEQFRSGFLSIPPGLYRAAGASGLTPFQSYRHIICPYAFRIIIPSFTTEFLTCFKNSALAMTIGVMEITHTAYYIDSFTWHGLETTTAATLCYLIMSLGIILVMGCVEKKVRIPGMIGRFR
ncbi:MAG: amino acid ABC transporter permease [Pseudomonadota bacterium]